MEPSIDFLIEYVFAYLIPTSRKCHVHENGCTHKPIPFARRSPNRRSEPTRWRVEENMLKPYVRLDQCRRSEGAVGAQKATNGR